MHVCITVLKWAINIHYNQSSIDNTHIEFIHLIQVNSINQDPSFYQERSLIIEKFYLYPP